MVSPSDLAASSSAAMAHCAVKVAATTVSATITPA
jgi:hypothetical protein